jgi:hypothetical protein
VHEVAFVADQVSDELPLVVTCVGLAVRVTVGTGVPLVTVTVADWLALPPAPVQDKVYVMFEVSGPTLWLPETALVPVQAPEAVHEVAFVADQVSDELPLVVTCVGLAEMETAGAGVTGGVAATGAATLVPAAPPPPQAATQRGKIRKSETRRIRGTLNAVCKSLVSMPVLDRNPLPRIVPFALKTAIIVALVIRQFRFLCLTSLRLHDIFEKQ